MATTTNTVLVYGGCGQMGSVVVNRFKNAKWKTVSVDLITSSIADHSITIKGDGTKDDTKGVVQKLQELKLQLDAVISVAGGFMMGNIKDEMIFGQVERMLSFNLRSAVAASFVASHALKEGGLLVLTGAYGALSPTPTFVAYGMSKAATHHLILSLAKEGSGMPANASVVGILPVMLDTVQNRKDMPSANFDDWTPLEVLTDAFIDWSSGKGRPANGSMMQVKTEKKVTTYTPVHFSNS